MNQFEGDIGITLIVENLTGCLPFNYFFVFTETA